MFLTMMELNTLQNDIEHGIDMNKRLKELVCQAKQSNQNLIWSNAELERFAELVRQDYLQELMSTESTAIAIMQAKDRALMTVDNIKINQSKE
jgi:hypothetical protein